MSEAVVFMENCPVESGGISTKDSKKCKHNSKRRRSKKGSVPGGSNNLNVEQVVNILCKSITKEDKFDASNLEPMENDFCKKDDPLQETSHLPSTSTSAASPDLTDLFENLQVHTLKNPISSVNVTEFLNVGLLKETSCKTLTAIEELEKIKNAKLNDPCITKAQIQTDADIPKEKMKDYFNLDLIRESPKESFIGKIEAGSMQLVTELEKSICCASECEMKNNDDKKYLTEYFNMKALKDKEVRLVRDIESTSKLIVGEFEKTLLEPKANNDLPRKEKERNVGQNPNEDTGASFDGRRKVFINSSLATLELSGSKKRKNKRSRKKKDGGSGTCGGDDMQDFTYPKYLSLEELESVSKYGVLLTGIVRINLKNYKEAYITAPDKGTDILIEGLRDRNRALEGDEVYFVLKPRESVSSADAVKQRTAVVVGIKTQSHDRTAIGMLKTSSCSRIGKSQFYWFSPRDSRLPRIKISRAKMPLGFFENAENFKDKLYFAQISRWNDVRFAEGDLIKLVGTAGDIEAETTALLLKHHLDVTPYPESLSKYFPSSPFSIPNDEFAKRQDLRKECIFTIDPETARDLDDAVSCSILPNGNYLVGVHISDVSWFLKEGTPLDEAVGKRATTVYLVQQVYHMLPRELCQMCSLAPGQDRLSFSVFWEIAHRDDDCYEILQHRFVRSVINSCAQLSYRQVQNLLDGKEGEESGAEESPITIHGAEHSLETIQEKVILLNKMGQFFRKKRFANGSLKIDQIKICFSLDEQGMPRKYYVYQNLESHQLIEEFMLLANITVAEELAKQFPKVALLRSHSVPLPFALEKLQKSMEKYGIILDISSSGALQSSLSKYAAVEQDLGSLARMLVLNNALAKPMSRAKYYCADLFPKKEDRHHYALNVPLYTHFTSPIRRYADVMVHRLLAAAVDEKVFAPNWAVDTVHRIATNCNKKKHAAKMASESSTELFLAVYIGLHGPLIGAAVVCDIKDKSFDCIILSTGVIQRIYFEQIPAPSSLVDDNDDGFRKLIIRWPKANECASPSIQIVEIFTIVQVELKRTDVLKVEAKLLKCFS